MIRQLKLEKQKCDIYVKEAVYQFLHCNSKKKYILGRNKDAERLSKLIDIDAFIDDFTEETIYLSKPIIKSKDIVENSIVVSCSLAIYPYSAIKALQRYGIKAVITYLDIMKYSGNQILSNDFFEQAINDLEINFYKYEWIYNKIKEEQSKRVLIDLLNFRKNLDLFFMKNYKVDLKGQYFEKFLDLRNNEVFVDAGGYDGQTSLEFIRYCKNYKSVYILEPLLENLNIAKKNLKEFKRIYFYQVGLSDQQALVKFDSNLGAASSVSEDGTSEIQVDTLDNLIDEKVTFIKMDIEGSESMAIKGSEMHILKYHPKLAICVYHKPADLWKIPEQILSIRNDYEIYLRHYTEGTDETVMFFVPIQ